jgi:hypothetical protein
MAVTRDSAPQREIVAVVGGYCVEVLIYRDGPPLIGIRWDRAPDSRIDFTIGPHRALILATAIKIAAAIAEKGGE